MQVFQKAVSYLIALAPSPLPYPSNPDRAEALARPNLGVVGRDSAGRINKEVNRVYFATIDIQPVSHLAAEGKNT